MARTTGSHADDTRSRILTAARELFVDRGYAADPTSRLRARCALGLIHAGVLAFERDPWAETSGTPGPPLPSPVRLDETGKRFVVEAALAVLAVPEPVTVGAPGGVDGDR